MSQPYRRTPAQKTGDFAQSKAFEQWVAQHLPAWRIDETDATDRLDFWVPGYYLEVKEKNQRLTPRWHLVPFVDEVNLFILDELSVRRALRYFPDAYFLLHDRPGGGRLFLASITEVSVADKVRRNRAGKGKWILDMTQFRQITDLSQITAWIQADLIGTPWKRSDCISAQLVPEI